MVSGHVRFTQGKGDEMSRVFIVFSFIAFFLQGAAFADDSLSRILKGIQDKYGHYPGLSITYTREVITQSMTMLGNQIKGDLATGKIYFKPSHFLRLEQETPESELIITDGDTLWWYIPGKKRAYQYPSREFGKELRLLGDIFSGLTRAEEAFQIAMLDRNEQGEIQIELKPDPPWQEIDRIVLTVTKTYDVSVVGIHNQMGGITRFFLKDMIVKGTFEKNFFRFDPPEGIELVKKEGQ